MTARDEAIEAAAKAVEDEMQLAVDYPGPIDDFPRTLAVAALSAVPVLLKDIADRIGGGIDLYPYSTPYAAACTSASNDALRLAVHLVRAAAEGWGATNG